MNEEKRTRAEGTRTKNRSLMSKQNTHPHTNRDVTHPAGKRPPETGHHRDDPSFKEALNSSDRFANSYGEDDLDEKIEDSEKLEVSGDEDFEDLEGHPEDDDDDFGVRDFHDDDEDIEEIKKSSRH